MNYYLIIIQVNKKTGANEELHATKNFWKIRMGKLSYFDKTKYIEAEKLRPEVFIY